MALTNMGAMIKLDPARARTEILSALKRNDCNRVKATKDLGAGSLRSLYRWIKQLELWPAVDGLSKEQGRSRSADRVLATMRSARGDRERSAKALGISVPTLEQRIVHLGLTEQVSQIRKC